MAGAFYCRGHASTSSQTDTRRLTLVLTFSAMLADRRTNDRVDDHLARADDLPDFGALPDQSPHD
jgi:hypothetical protein